MSLPSPDLMNSAASEIDGESGDALASATTFSHRWLSDYDYALLNPLRLEQEEWQDLPLSSLTPQWLKEQSAYMPMLLSVKDLTALQRSTLLSRIETREQRGEAFLTGLLSSHAERPGLVAHLCRLLVMTRQDNGQRYLLRYYDPRVMRHLQWLLNDQQHAALYGPADIWAWPVSNGWVRNTRRSTEYSVGTRLILEPRQWETLERMALINRALSELEILAPDLPHDDMLSQRLDAALAQAKTELALPDSEDWLFCAIQAVRFHPQIHHHPQLLERLAHAATRRSSYAAACADVDDAAWLSMAAQMNAPLLTA